MNNKGEKEINLTSPKFKILCIEGHHQQSEKTAQDTGENISA